MLRVLSCVLRVVSRVSCLVYLVCWVLCLVLCLVVCLFLCLVSRVSRVLLGGVSCLASSVLCLCCVLRHTRVRPVVEVVELPHPPHEGVTVVRARLGAVITHTPL